MKLVGWWRGVNSVWAAVNRWLQEHIPLPLKRWVRAWLGLPTDKHTVELDYWQRVWEAKGRRFTNSHFRWLMLAMAGEQDEAFLAGKVVADFGCGPCGSLSWATGAQERIGIDVLADQYAARFDLATHGMRYVTSSETAIPLPDDYVDILFTLNAMDHVNHFETICQELLRILKPGGELIGSFNLDERPTLTEPQRLTEERINRHLLDHLIVKSYRLAARGPANHRYLHFFDGQADVPPGNPRVLWVRAAKPSQ